MIGRYELIPSPQGREYVVVNKTLTFCRFKMYKTKKRRKIAVVVSFV